MIWQINFFGQSHARWHPLYPVSTLSEANHQLAPATYLAHGYESGISIPIFVITRTLRNKFPKMLNYSFDNSQVARDKFSNSHVQDCI